MANVFLKNNKVNFVFEPNSINNRTGFIYDLGVHAIDFLWLPLDEVELMLRNYAYKYMDNEISEEEYKKDIFSFTDSLYNYSPYLYFYIESLSQYIVDALKFFEDKTKKQTSLEKFLNSLSEIITLAKSDASNELIEDDIGILVLYCENMINIGTSYKKIFNAAISLIISDIILKQGYIKTEVDLILETVNGTNGLSPNQKLYFLDSQRKHKKYIDQPFEIRLLPHPLNYKSNIEDIIKKDITIIEMYKINSLDDLIRFEMFNVVSHNIPINKCKNCGYYFIPLGRKDAAYCDRVSINKKIPCSKIGAKKIYDDKIKDDPNLHNYKRAYNRMQSRYRNKKITQTELYEWTEHAKKIRKDYLNGKIDKIDL